ncbi:MAG: DUF3306 domain-containing protein [Burkholderiales bacterium]
MSEDQDKESSGGQGGEAFLSRWSRLKREARNAPPDKLQPAAKAVDAAAAPQLPPLDELTADSDFRGFFHPKVDEALRRSALKKLFADPRFNVMDGLDVYIDDYSVPNPLPAAMLAQLKQAQQIIEWAKEGTEGGDENGRAQTTAQQATRSVAALADQRDAAAAGSISAAERALTKEQDMQRSDTQTPDEQKP